MKYIKKLLVLCVICLALAGVCTEVSASGFSGEPAKKVTNSKKLHTVSFYSEGKVCFKRKVKEGGRLTLPSLPNRGKKRFLGWTDTKKQTGKTKYFPGKKYKVTRNKKLYAVFFDNSSEKNLDATKLTKFDQKKYSGVIFVGDSRTAMMKDTLKHELGKNMPENVYFVAKGGATLSWFKNTGYDQLMEILDDNEDTRPMAVIFNLGVNSLKHVIDEEFDEKAVSERYIRYYQEIAEDIYSVNASLFLMSVNPINSKMLLEQGSRSEAELNRFNRRIKEALATDYEYIDTNQWLQKNGYSTGQLTVELDDGLHYTALTQKRIYNYCMKQINAA